MSRASMNHTYRLVWSESLSAFVAVAETARARGKRNSRAVALVVSLWLASMGAAHAADPVGWLPTGGRVVAGSGSVEQTGQDMTVTQNTHRLITNWDTFNIGANGSVTFLQPDASSIALNRVLDANPSQIFGRLSANGRVFLLNPNGIVFGATAQVNVGGLVASSLSLSNEDFLADNYSFTNAGASGSIVNQGTLNAEHGVIALLGPRVTNAGTINTDDGSTVLAAGDTIGLDFQGDGLVTVNVDQGAYNALAQNHGLIQADGGLVTMTARGASSLLETVVNNDGVIQARTLQESAGRILLLGDMEHGRVTVDGTLDASAPSGGDGGFIETSAASVHVTDELIITTLASSGMTGEWLIDPNDYTIAAAGGDITGAALASMLDATNVTIETTLQGTSGGNGDIFVNDAIARTGGAATTLTLLAERNIEINQGITSGAGRLNVVLTADSDANNTGDVTFGAGGHVVTHDGNFYVANVAGMYDDVTASGQNFTMASGSYINSGQGNLVVAVNGAVSLPDNSSQAVTYALSSTNLLNSSHYFNNGMEWLFYQAPYQYLRVSGASIATANTNASVSDILTSATTILYADAIGSSLIPIKISGPGDIGNGTQAFTSWGRSLSITNYVGDSYVHEMGNQIFGSIEVNIGAQSNATQNVQIMGDAGGNGTSGTGHIILRTDGAGALNVATGDIRTGGIPGVFNALDPGTSIDPAVFPTNVSISASNISFDDNAVDVGGSTFYWVLPDNHAYYPYYYSAAFTAHAHSLMRGQSANRVAEINATNVWLVGPELGTMADPIEVANGSFLNLVNSGSSTFIRVVDDSFASVHLTNTAVPGTHSILFSGGDHYDLETDAGGITVSSLSARSDGSTFGVTSGIDGSGANRTFSLSAQTGTIGFDIGAVNLGTGALELYISPGNADTDAGRSIFALNSPDGVAEITAGDVTLGLHSVTSGSVSGLEFAHSDSDIDAALNVTTYGHSDIEIHELTENGFDSFRFYLYSSQAPQHFSVDLVGADDLDFSDNGSVVSLDANGVALASGGRDFILASNTRAVQVDSTSAGAGDYLIQVHDLRLNGDVLTNGGTIALYGLSDITLLDSIRIDSNADDASNLSSTSASGNIVLYGSVSAQSPGYSLALDASSSTDNGAYVQQSGNFGNASGAYLSGLSFDAGGANGDGVVILQGSNYLLNGDFSSFGHTYLFGNDVVIDTEQGNTASAGSIRFGGTSEVFNPSSQFMFDASTTAAGMNGGDVDLAGTSQVSILGTRRVTILATAGAGGEAGDISLPSISATTSGVDNTLTFRGDLITLHGDITTERGDVMLDGDVRLANTVTIDTWQSAAPNVLQSGTAGSVQINTVSATNQGHALTIRTDADTGAGHYNSPLNTQSWTHNGGDVSVQADDAGGFFIDSLTVINGATGDYNAGTDGSITLGAVGTAGAQFYQGGETSASGNLTTDGGDIDFSNVADLTLSAGTLLIDTDRIGGTNDAGAIDLGGFDIDGPLALTIDATADGGGAGADFTLPLMGDSLALTSLDASGRSITVSGNIVAAGGVRLRATNGIALAVDTLIDTSGNNGDITLDAGIDAMGVSRALALNAGTGSATIAGAIGSNLALSAVAITSNSIAMNGGGITTLGSQTYNGDITLGADAILSTTSSSITFDGTLDSSGAAHALIANTGSATTTFSDVVGGGMALSSLTVNGVTSIDTNAITTIGAQIFNGATTLDYDDGSGQLTQVTLTTGNDDVTFTSTVNDDAPHRHALQISAGSGTSSFEGTVGDSAELFGIYVDGPTVIGGDMTYGRAEFFGAVMLIADVTLTQTCCYGTHFHSRIDGAHALTLNGLGSAMDGEVGGGIALTSLNVFGDLDIAADITTTGKQTYTGNVRLVSGAATLTQTDSNTDFEWLANRTLTSMSGGDASLTIRSARDIIIAGGSSFSSTAGRLDVTLNARAGNGASGAIIFNDGVSGAGAPVAVLSNGGDIKLVGGSNGNAHAIGGSNSYAFGTDSHQDGVSLAHVTLDTRVYVSGTPQTNGGGGITIHGMGYEGSIAQHGGGFWADNSSFHTGGGAFSLNAAAQRSGNPTTGGIRYGAFLDTMTLTTNGGGVDITTPSTSIDTGLWLVNVAPRAIAAGSGDISITTDKWTLGGNQTLESSGQLIIRPYTNGSTIGIAGGAGTLQVAASHFTNNFADGFSRVTIGSAAAGAITVGGATTFNDAIAFVSGAAINLDAALDAAGQTLTLTGGSGSLVSGNGNIVADGLLLDGANSSYLLNTASGNQINTLAGSGIASVNFTNSGSFAVGSVEDTDGLSSLGAITLHAAGASADITLDLPVMSVGGDLVLAADRDFVNRNALGTGVDAGAGRYFVYSTNPSDTEEGMGDYSKHYDQTYAPGSTPSYASTGNWFFYAIAPVLNVTPNATSTAYGSAPAFTRHVSGFIDGDTLLGAQISGTATYSINGPLSGAGFASVGTHDGVYTGGLASTLGYAFQNDVTSTNELTVTQAQLNVTGLSAVSRVYDTTLQAALSDSAAIAEFAGDAVILNGTGVGIFGDKNVGEDKAVSVTGYSISGADAINYQLVQPTGLTADVTATTLEVTGLSAQDRVYDATTQATLIGAASIAALGGDVVTLVGTGVGEFADKNVGEDKIVSVTGYSVIGADAGNYQIVQPAGLLADITPAPLSVSGVAANNRVYDSTRTATLLGSATVTGLAGDNVQVDGIGVGQFGDKNVGDDKSVSVTGYSLSGTDASNYRIVQPTGLTAHIAAATVTVAGLMPVSRAFDTTAHAEIGSYGTLAGVISGDAVTLETSLAHASFADGRISTGKEVTVAGLSLSGADAGNYLLVVPTGAADIDPINNPAVDAVITSNDLTATHTEFTPTDFATSTGRAIVLDMRSEVQGGGSSEHTVKQRGDRIMLNFGNGGSSAATQQVILPVYHADGDAVALQGQVLVIDRGASLTLLPTASRLLATQVVPSSDEDASIKLSDASLEGVSVALNSGGVLTITTSVVGDELDGDERQLIARAIAHLREQFGVSVDSLSAVVMSRGH